MHLTGASLTPAETKLIEEIHLGNSIEFETGLPQQYMLSGKFLRSILIEDVRYEPANGPVISGKISAPILSLKNAVILGALDLSETGNPSKPLPHIKLENCILTGPLKLRTAVLGGLSLKSCWIMNGEETANKSSFSIDADGAHFSDSVQVEWTRLTQGTQLIFDHARIDNTFEVEDVSGPADCERAHLLASKLNLLDESKGSENCLLKEKLKSCANDFNELQDGVKSLIGSLSAGANDSDFTGMISLRSARIAGDVLVKCTSILKYPPEPTENAPKPEYDRSQIAIDLKGSRIAGDFELCGSNDKASILGGQVNAYCAEIGGNFYVHHAEIAVTANKSFAIYADACTITGNMIIGYGEDLPRDGVHPMLCELKGSLKFSGAKIGRQLVIQQVSINPPKTEKNGKVRPFVAVFGDGADIHDDLFIISHPCQRAGNDSRPILIGGIRLPGATIGGQLNLQGAHIKSDKFALSARDITVRGGIFLQRSGILATKIEGIIKLTGATLSADFSIDGSNLCGKPAIEANNIKIKGDLHIGWNLLAPNSGSEMSPNSCNKICGGIEMRGARIDGEIGIRRAEITVERDSAFILSGATIEGGIEIKGDDGNNKKSYDAPSFRGGLRLNQARIGRKFLLQDTTIHQPSKELGDPARPCPARSADEVVPAIWAKSTRFDGDIELRDVDLCGEVRLTNASIGGGMKVIGGRILHPNFGFAIDAYDADIRDGLKLQPSNGQDLVINGILGCAFSKLGSFSIGSPDPNTEDRDRSTHSVQINGHMRLTGMKVDYVTAIRDVEITPPAKFASYKDRENLMSTLGRWNVKDRTLFLAASHADFGLRLDIKLSEKTTGTVDLGRASVKTLSDDGGDAWGILPTGEIKAWSGEAQADYSSLSGVHLILSGFRYESTRDTDSTRLEDRYKKREKWLNQQFPNKKATIDTYKPGVYIYLADVFRKGGFAREANQISMDRRRMHVRYGTETWLDRFLQRLFGSTFGFGYSSWRALRTLSFLLVVNVGFSYLATHHTDLPCNWVSDSFLRFVTFLRANYSCALNAQSASHFGIPSWAYEVGGHLVTALNALGITGAALTFSGILRESHK